MYPPVQLRHITQEDAVICCVDRPHGDVYEAMLYVQQLAREMQQVGGLYSS